MDLDSRGLVTRYRRTVSRLAATLQDPDTLTERPHPSSSESKTTTLPSPLEWAAFIRECVSTSQGENDVP